MFVFERAGADLVVEPHVTGIASERAGHAPVNRPAPIACGTLVVRLIGPAHVIEIAVDDEHAFARQGSNQYGLWPYRAGIRR